MPLLIGDLKIRKQIFADYIDLCKKTEPYTVLKLIYEAIKKIDNILFYTFVRPRKKKG